MRDYIRTVADKSFSIMTITAVVLIILALVGILFPMISKGSKAVFFTETIEFRKMQFAKFGRGSKEEIESQAKESDEYREVVYEKLTSFSRGINSAKLIKSTRSIYRNYGKSLRYQGVEGSEYANLRRNAKRLRDHLCDAFKATDKEIISKKIAEVLDVKYSQMFAGTQIEQYFTIAKEYLEATETIDLSRKDEYTKKLKELRELLHQLLGPNPDEKTPALSMYRYGATRMDMANIALDNFLWIETWVQNGDRKSLMKVRTPRKESFAGTPIETIFDYIPQNLDKMLLPNKTIYWQYFIDDSTPGHYFGGIGPEILGTLLITAISILFAVPLGIICAAYLVECAKDNFIVRIIRISINTLAGVPSIVFGLFGLAFFVIYLFPIIGLESKSCILAASLTLAILTLPVVIRASEEAIRSVPQRYKEASLGLGAGKFSTFMRVTLPTALPGIMTGIILSISRVAGETAPILFTGAVALGPLPESILHPTRTLSYGSYDMAVGDRISQMVPHNQYGMIVSLVLLIMLLNGIAIVLRTRISKKLQQH